jgi:hypothetical protein
MIDEDIEEKSKGFYLIGIKIVNQTNHGMKKRDYDEQQIFSLTLSFHNESVR